VRVTVQFSEEEVGSGSEWERADSVEFVTEGRKEGRRCHFFCRMMQHQCLQRCIQRSEEGDDLLHLSGVRRVEGNEERSRRALGKMSSSTEIVRLHACGMHVKPEVVRLEKGETVRESIHLVSGGQRWKLGSERYWRQRCRIAVEADQLSFRWCCLLGLNQGCDPLEENLSFMNEYRKW
jgi:hypothetical protein